MYVVCDNNKPLSHGWLSCSGLAESIIRYRSAFPEVISVNVYYEPHGSSDANFFTYVMTLNKAQLDKFCKNLSSRLSIAGAGDASPDIDPRSPDRSL